ncbi:hypothetical protein [Longispora albida]|nr:hypothetical protein [Longispora albida]
MSADQDLPVTGASAAVTGMLGGALAALGALLVAAAQWGARLRNRTAA